MQLLMHLGANLILLVSLVGSASAFTAQALHVPAFIGISIREKRSGMCELGFFAFLVSSCQRARGDAGSFSSNACLRHILYLIAGCLLEIAGSAVPSVDCQLLHSTTCTY